MNQGALRPDEPQSFAQAGTMRHGARRIVRPPTRFADGHQHQQQGNACEREDDEGMAPAEFFGQYPAADSPDTRTDGNTEREYHHSDNPLRRLEIVSQYRMGRGRTAGFADANADARAQQLPEILRSGGRRVGKESVKKL